MCVAVCRCPSWSDDEKISVRSVNNELHFYENNDFSKKPDSAITQSELDPMTGGDPPVQGKLVSQTLGLLLYMMTVRLQT